MKKHVIVKVFKVFLLTCVTYQAYGQDALNKLQVIDTHSDLLWQSDYQSLQGYQVQPEWTLQAFEQGESVVVKNKVPLFGWIMNERNSSSRQQYYQLLLADNLNDIKQNRGNLWNSGKVRSSESTAVVYGGNDLSPGNLYYWKVKVWDEQGNESEFSPLSCFYTGQFVEGYETTTYPLQRTDQTPKKLIKREQEYFIDFEKAAFGQLRLNLDSPVADTILIRFGEKITAEGKIDRNPGGTIRYQEYRLPLSQGTNTYQIKFRKDQRNTGQAAVLMPDYIGEVLPFRYVEIEGYDHPLHYTDVKRSMVHYPFNDNASYFHSSNEILNQVWDLSKYSIKATSFAGIYVDGDRERIPYEADALINQLCHYCVDNEFTMARASHEYLLHNATWPTEWIMQSVMMAWNDYLYTGDLRSVSAHYETLKAKTLTGLEDSNGLISTKTGKQSSDLLKSINLQRDTLRDIVDWPHSGILGLGKKEQGETDGFVFRPYNAVVNAYYYHALRLMARLAKEMERADDFVFFNTKADKLYNAYQKYFFDKERKVVRDGIGTDHSALHSNMFALAFGLVPEASKKEVVAYIHSRGMACSVYGSQFLMDALYEAGAGDYAFQLLTAETERSWYNMIRVGSTISLEAWDDKYKPNQDWNHAWGAVPANIIPRKLMGIEPLEPGWDTFRIQPQLADLEYAKIRFPTIKGYIDAAYKQSANRLEAQLSIPANTVAEIYLPLKNSRGKPVLYVDGKEYKYELSQNWIKLPDLGTGNKEIIVVY
ncbi:Bacterial alpha-L-rhamnosidase [Sphingobacterium phlebotomi]|uniref:alpha-L-rhamnosidase n=1 Tax=Sphingobacterium phlebotomi TaxID=2605433 RepID=A0A5D4HFH2_9SPHI|nr:alpha-L-rhamnosidase C-terminal domain-containing protein [Sphingobacterium phlebotomi]TYR37580.1 Bacterial alpha-L-rhamnosidase [Sphingobacterium phlebotomi]